MHYYVRYDPGQRWYFLDRQTPDEALVFKHFDSKPGIEAPCMDLEFQKYLCRADFTRHRPLQHKTVVASRQSQAETKY